MECYPHKGCFARTSYNKLNLKKYGKVSGEQAMMDEIQNWGPITCAIDASSIQNYRGYDIIKTAGAATNHYVSVTGWGLDTDGTKFWIVRNSWGEVFGNEGFARVLKGNGGALGIESDCYWANGEIVWKQNDTENSTPQLPEKEDPVE